MFKREEGGKLKLHRPLSENTLFVPFGAFPSEKGSGFEAYIEGGLHVHYFVEHMGLTL